MLVVFFTFRQSVNIMFDQENLKFTWVPEVSGPPPLAVSAPPAVRKTFYPEKRPEIPSSLTFYVNFLKNDENLFESTLAYLIREYPDTLFESRAPRLYTQDWSQKYETRLVYNAVDNTFSSGHYRVVKLDAVYNKDYTFANISACVSRGSKFYQFLIDSDILERNFPSWFRNLPYNEKLIRDYIPDVEIDELKKLSDKDFSKIYQLLERLEIESSKVRIEEGLETLNESLRGLGLVRDRKKQYLL
jgi:hypothetical protein